MNQIQISYEISLRTAINLQYATRELKDQELTATNVITFTLEAEDEAHTEDLGQEYWQLLEEGYNCEVIAVRFTELD